MPCGRHRRLVVEDAAEVIAVGKHVDLVRQVGAARVDEVDAGQAVLARDVLRAQVLLHRQRVVGAALDGRVVADDHAFAAGHAADAGDDAGGGDRRRRTCPYAASCENSRNGEPGSSSARTRSRGSSLPRADVLRARRVAAALLDRRRSSRAGRRPAPPSPRGSARTSRSRGSSLDSMTGMAVGRAGVSRERGSDAEQRVRRPRAADGRASARRDGPSAAARAMPREPVADVRIAVPVDADLVGPEQVAAERQVGDGQPVADDVARARRGARRARPTPSRRACAELAITAGSADSARTCAGTAASPCSS